MQAAPNDHWCTICEEYLLKPAILDCGHWFCCYCLKSIAYENESKKVKCPLCRFMTDKPKYQREKQKEVIRSLMKQTNARVFWAEASTTNDYDGNLCKSQGFFYILRGTTLFGDVVWGEGTSHNTYNEEVGRATGQVKINPECGDMEYLTYGSKYSNTPHEEWFGTFKNQFDGVYILQCGRYNWHGWGRHSSGTLQMRLKEITDEETLSAL